jgi:hypothetical protein
MLTAQIHGKWQSFGGVFFGSSAKLLNIFKNGWLGNYSYKQLTRHSNRTKNSWLFARASLILANYLFAV